MPTLVMPKTISIDVASVLMDPTSLHPTTWGNVKETGWPSITASDSIPPTPKTEEKLLIASTCLLLHEGSYQGSTLKFWSLHSG